MAEYTWPSPGYNSRAVTDREYEELVSAYAGDGLVGDTADSAPIYADGSGMLVKVRANKRALVRAHMWASGTTDYTKTVTANASGALRQDLVVLRLTRATWAVTVEVKAGTPGAGLPALQQDLANSGFFEIPIAVVQVASGAASIAAGDVTPVGWYLGSTELRCTSSTRPPAVNGRRIFETDTARAYLAVGTTFVRLIDERTGFGELGPFTLPQFANVGSIGTPGPVVLFDQYVTCRPAHFHNVEIRLKPQGSATYTHVTVSTEIDGTVIQNSGADLINSYANVAAEKSYRVLGWRSGSGQTSFRLRVLVARHSGGNVSATENGQLSVVDNGAGSGSI